MGLGLEFGKSSYGERTSIAHSRILLFVCFRCLRFLVVLCGAISEFILAHLPPNLIVIPSHRVFIYLYSLGNGALAGDLRMPEIASI